MLRFRAKRSGRRVASPYCFSALPIVALEAVDPAARHAISAADNDRVTVGKQKPGIGRAFDAVGSGTRARVSSNRGRAFHERAAAGVFPPEAVALEGRDPARGARDASAPAEREREPPRYRRPRLLGDRPLNRTQGARPPAQADLQDRRGTHAYRGRHLRLLRGDRRADLSAALGSAPDRDAVDRRAGAARAEGKSPPRRAGLIPQI